MTPARTLLRNIAMLSAASYVEMAFGLALGVVVARALGSVEFGKYAFTVWMCGTLITTCNNALTYSAIKFIAEARGAGDMVLRDALHARLRRWQGWTCALVLGVFGLAMLVNPPREWTDSALLISALVVIGAWSRSGYMTMAAIGKGHERFEVESGALTVSAAINLLLVGLLALAGGTLAGFFAIYAVCGLCQNLVARIALRKLGIQDHAAPIPAPLMARLKRHLWQTGVLIVIGMLGDRTMEVLLLKHFSTSQALGFFAIAGALTKGATYVLSGALSSVLLPSMSRAFGKGVPGAVTGMLREAIRFYWFIGLMIAGLGLTVAPGMVRLFYGSEYEAAIPAVVANFAIGGAALLMAALNAYQMASDRQADRIKAMTQTWAVNVAVAFALVPAFGLTGALGSLALTKAAMVFFTWRAVRRSSGASLPLARMGRLLAAAAIGVALGALVLDFLPGHLGFLVAGPVFMLGYLAFSVVLGCWTLGDYEFVGSILDRAGTGRGRPAALLARLASRFGSTDAAPSPPAPLLP